MCPTEEIHMPRLNRPAAPDRDPPREGLLLPPVAQASARCVDAGLVAYIAARSGGAVLLHPGAPAPQTRRQSLWRRDRPATADRQRRQLAGVRLAAGLYLPERLTRRGHRCVVLRRRHDLGPTGLHDDHRLAPGRVVYRALCRLYLLSARPPALGQHRDRRAGAADDGGDLPASAGAGLLAPDIGGAVRASR